MRKLVDDITVQNAYMQAIQIVEDVGVRFESEVVRELFKKRGARVEGDKVFIPRHLMEEALETPKRELSLPHLLATHRSSLKMILVRYAAVILGMQ